MRSSTRYGLLAAAAIAMAGSGMVETVQRRPRKESSEPRTRRVAVTATGNELAREIAEHNAGVERRKAEKKAAKLARRGA